MGCVASTLRFFDDGKLSAKRWNQAQTEIAVELQQFAADYRAQGWGETIGSSGTVKAIGNVAAGSGLVRHRHHARRAVAYSRRDRRERQHRQAAPARARRRPHRRVRRRRRDPRSRFAALDIKQMRVCETAMREGLLYDMIGRAEHRDPRTASIDALALRYAVDRAPCEPRRGDGAGAVRSGRRRLAARTADATTGSRWAARIHEIGLAIAHSQHHLHGAYIVENSDLAGFARHEQQVLAAILRSHRRKPDPAVMRSLPERLRRPAARVTALLRLAVLLQRARAAEPLPPIRTAGSMTRPCSSRLPRRLARAASADPYRSRSGTRLSQASRREAAGQGRREAARLEHCHPRQRLSGTMVPARRVDHAIPLSFSERARRRRSTSC